MPGSSAASRIEDTSLPAVGASVAWSRQLSGHANVLYQVRCRHSTPRAVRIKTGLAPNKAIEPNRTVSSVRPRIWVNMRHRRNGHYQFARAGRFGQQKTAEAFTPVVEVRWQFKHMLTLLSLTATGQCAKRGDADNLTHYLPSFLCRPLNETSRGPHANDLRFEHLNSKNNRAEVQT